MSKNTPKQSARGVWCAKKKVHGALGTAREELPATVEALCDADDGKRRGQSEAEEAQLPGRKVPRR